MAEIDIGQVVFKDDERNERNERFNAHGAGRRTSPVLLSARSTKLKEAHAK